jgi:MOSC domain-containing protein
LALDLAEVVGHLSLLQRFPIEPLSGETPNTVRLASGGFVGDRVYEVQDARSGEPLTVSTSPQLLSFTARYLEDLVAEELDRWMRIRTPEGKEYGFAEPDLAERLSRAVGRPVRLAHRNPDTNPLRVVSRPTLRLAERTYGAPLEPQRVRANLIIEIAEGKAFDEDRWIGRRLRIGEALLEVTVVSTGCIETALPNTTAGGDADLLAGLVKIHGGHLGVAARAAGGQRLRAGDPVVLVD